jgi:hypothetical protein
MKTRDLANLLSTLLSSPYSKDYFRSVALREVFLYTRGSISTVNASISTHDRALNIAAEKARELCVYTRADSNYFLGELRELLSSSLNQTGDERFAKLSYCQDLVDTLVP